MSFTNRLETRVNVPVQKIEVPNVEVVEEASYSEQAKRLLQQTQNQCEKLVNEAKKKREKALENLEVEIKQIKKKTREEAFKAGYLQGVTQGELESKEKLAEQSKQIINELKDSCFKMQKENTAYLNELNYEILPLMKTIVEKVIFQTIEDSEEKILPLINSQFKDLMNRQQIFIRVAPNSYDLVKKNQQELEKQCLKSKIQIISDPSLSDYGCTIETEREVIDLQIDQQINQLFTELNRVVRK